MKSNPLSDLQALTLCLIRSIERCTRTFSRQNRTMRCLFYAVLIVVNHLTSNTVTATAHSDKVELATLNDVGFLRGDEITR
ncbi:hypothetical protein GQ600_218 [Phytophthora cactorum]|nr:hypothetical protein GQ600_218 [Phytophthora cactorum]